MAAGDLPFVMLDAMSPFVTEEEAVRWIEQAKTLPQTSVVKREIEEAERILRDIRAKQH